MCVRRGTQFPHSTTLQSTLFYCAVMHTYKVNEQYKLIRTYNLYINTESIYI